ncbi:P-loop containing nucleoside triphosphate hydrolase protein [Gigaspora rosea]|uniref:P-loop containing nucleoside triphosphate hydrolase protein n=1 Tax=Gigaspora rosea TaxID=44941 RepID=A0A397UPD3_9GLOM|nr:P-loop containing nucleoside triphosphate hydrolase protein [Gigaspora rosea]
MVSLYLRVMLLSKGNEQAKEAVQNTKLKPMREIFRKGAQYNMKIIIRGDIRTGKTTLFNRLQGESFREEYITTPQIQVANIQWNYNQTNDVIKVEIWDVVDKGINPANINQRPTASSAALKIENSQIPTKPPPPNSSLQSPDQLSLDAATIDVYRNTHGVILLFDITKNWTFDYAIKELKAIPRNMAILLLVNINRHLSFGTPLSYETFFLPNRAIADINRERISEYPSANMVRYVETSMLSGLGLEYIYKYFGVPFLQLQRDILRQQLASKTKELAKLLDTLDLDDSVSDSVKKRHSTMTDTTGVKDIEPELRKDRLEEEKTQLKKLWNKEFDEELSQQKESVESLSSTIPKLQVEQPLSDTLLYKRPKATTPDTTIIDEFNAGDLEDDFFDDTPDPVVVLPPVTQSKNDEVEDMDSKNPMVATDEDLVGVEGYDDVEEDKPNVRQSFNSGLNDVWKNRYSNVTLASRVSDSSDDELTQTISKKRDSHHDFEESSFDDTGGTPSGYEEIGEGQDNPWL